MCRVVAAAILAAGVLWSVPGRAEEIGAAGEAVVARVERPGGDRYEITVTPPADRGVDRRVMEWLTDTGAAAGAEEAGADDPVDIGGYRVRVEKTVSASCTSSFAIKSKPTNLAVNHAWSVESDSAAFISASAFPTKGDVDVRIFAGTNGDVCDQSVRKKQNMDSAGCHVKICELLAGVPHVRAEVYNSTTTQATAVADFELGFVSLP